MTDSFLTENQQKVYKPPVFQNERPRMSGWKVELGTHRCARCGGYVASLVKRDETGHFVHEEIPLLCLSCGTLREFLRCSREIVKVAESIEDIARLLDELAALKAAVGSQ
jgi:hypothetical protein